MKVEMNGIDTCSHDTDVSILAEGGGGTGLMVRASDSGSGDPGSILGLEQETITPQKYW